MHQRNTADLLRHFLEDIGKSGLNVAGVAAPDRYDSVVPAARRTSVLHPATQSIIVVASGGGLFWERFMQAARHDATLLTDQAHPLDAFARITIERADVAFGAIARRWFFAAGSADVHLDFRLLGAHAGMGARSRLGLLLNDTYGTWLGMRAACFIDMKLDASPERTADPCEGCPGHCALACPGSAFPSGSWDVDACTSFHADDSRCASTCHARVACPKGAAFAYSDLERTYHYDRFTGRRLLRESLGISRESDRYEGEGPLWNTWRKRANVKG
jgi:hypothetical protein